MSDRTYRITFFKKLPGTAKPYGAKHFVGNLDRACKRLVKKFGLQATVRVVRPGVYVIGDGEAEMEVVR